MQHNSEKGGENLFFTVCGKYHAFVLIFVLFLIDKSKS